MDSNKVFNEDLDEKLFVRKEKMYVEEDNTEEFDMDQNISQIFRKSYNKQLKNISSSSDIKNIYHNAKNNLNILAIFLISLVSLTLFFLIYTFFYSPNITLNELNNFNIDAKDLNLYKSNSLNKIEQKNFDISLTELLIFFKKNFGAHSGNYSNWIEKKVGNSIILKLENDITDVSLIFSCKPDTTKPESIVIIYKYKESDEFLNVSKSIELKSKKNIEYVIKSVISSIDIDSFYTAEFDFEAIETKKSESIGGYNYNFFKYPKSKILVTEITKK